MRCVFLSGYGSGDPNSDEYYYYVLHTRRSHILRFQMWALCAPAAKIYAIRPFTRLQVCSIRDDMHLALGHTCTIFSRISRSPWEIAFPLLPMKHGHKAREVAIPHSTALSMRSAGHNTYAVVRAESEFAMFHGEQFCDFLLFTFPLQRSATGSEHLNNYRKGSGDWLRLEMKGWRVIVDIANSRIPLVSDTLLLLLTCSNIYVVKCVYASFNCTKLRKDMVSVSHFVWLQRQRKTMLWSNAAAIVMSSKTYVRQTSHCCSHNSQPARETVRCKWGVESFRFSTHIFATRSAIRCK